jgi:hypothetical protein
VRRLLIPSHEIQASNSELAFAYLNQLDYKTNQHLSHIRANWNFNEMKQITIAVPDNMSPFFMQLVENLNLTKVTESVSQNESTKETILKGIKEGVKEVKLHKQGKLKLKTAKQLFNDL